ncbi:hypothetical protein CGLO_09004 [Colletotrichum gloeosporioides Cg-14]|uniref:Uncharacterized protein n=1 Tax=Colletotrichum gloeosporioides (strain Cg-14) TaxID=1237896 RepID=T0LIT8_COLGC|nr:hypothetical protein CGLO_09004 [Colletotrichum gloeosporioides Cg-14]
MSASRRGPHCPGKRGWESGPFPGGGD